MITKEHIEIERLIIKYANAITPSVQENVEEAINIIFASLYTRIINSYYAVNLLLVEDCLIEALTIMRSSLEARMVMSALLTENKSELVIEKLHNQSIYNMEKTIELEPKYFNTYDEKPFKADKNKKSSIYYYAKIVGENGTIFYDAEYSLLCNLVHINKESISLMLSTNEGKNFMTNSIDYNVFVPHYRHFIFDVVMTIYDAYTLHKINLDDDFQLLLDLLSNLYDELELNDGKGKQKMRILQEYERELMCDTPEGQIYLQYYDVTGGELLGLTMPFGYPDGVDEMGGVIEVYKQCIAKGITWEELLGIEEDGEEVDY